MPWQSYKWWQPDPKLPIRSGIGRSMMVGSSVFDSNNSWETIWFQEEITIKNIYYFPWHKIHRSTLSSSGIKEVFEIRSRSIYITNNLGHIFKMALPSEGDWPMKTCRDRRVGYHVSIYQSSSCVMPFSSTFRVPPYVHTIHSDVIISQTINLFNSAGNREQ